APGAAPAAAGPAELGTAMLLETTGSGRAGFCNRTEVSAALVAVTATIELAVFGAATGLVPAAIVRARARRSSSSRVAVEPAAAAASAGMTFVCARRPAAATSKASKDRKGVFTVN